MENKIKLPKTGLYYRTDKDEIPHISVENINHEKGDNFYYVDIVEIGHIDGESLHSDQWIDIVSIFSLVHEDDLPIAVNPELEKALNDLC